MKMIGQVTSSYYSPTLKRSIAMGLIRNGRDRMGDTISFPLEDKVVTAKIVGSGFLRQGRQASKWLMLSVQARFPPLRPRAGCGYAVSVEEVAGRGMIDLRGNPNDAAFMAAAQKALGLELPTEPRTCATKARSVSCGCRLTNGS